LRFRGRPHAGGGPLPHADGQDVGRPRRAGPRGHPLHLDSDESDDRRRVRLVRDAGRCHHRRAWGGGRLRGAAGDQADDRAGPAGRVPDGGVPRRARDGRHGRPARRAPRHYRPAAAPYGRPPARRGRRLSRLSFADACRFLFSRQAGRIKWSLAPTEGLLAALDHPERRFPTIHVGGTNGKGSTCTFLAAELQARGFRVGLYTSPHLVSMCERIAVNGEPITEDALAAWTGRLQADIERLDASFFEATTAIAFAELAARGVDIAVIEVGLGGRLDA